MTPIAITAAVLFAFVVGVIVGVIVGALVFAAYDFADQQLRDEEPESAWRGSQGGGVHADGMTQTGARHHVR